MDKKTNNTDRLTQYLADLNTKSNYSAIKIETIGNSIYILKDKPKLYCLFVPNYPLNDHQIKKIKELGYNEKYRKINFTREFDLSDHKTVVSTLLTILSEILNVPNDKPWRFEINSGMKVIKANNPEIPNSIRRETIKNSSIKNKMMKFINNLFGRQ